MIFLPRKPNPNPICKSLQRFFEILKPALLTSTFACYRCSSSLPFAGATIFLTVSLTKTWSSLQLAHKISADW